MDMIETLIVVFAGVAALGLGGPRVEAIQAHAELRWQQLVETPVADHGEIPLTRPRQCTAR
jgi:hypothetical protein